MKTLKNNIYFIIASSLNIAVLSGCESCDDTTSTTTTNQQQQIDHTASLLYTADGGNTWTKESINLVKELRAISSLDLGSMTAVGQNASVSSIIYDGVVVHKSYMDTTWLKQTATTGKILYDIAGINTSGKGVAVGQEGLILLTDNDGLTWTSVSNPLSTSDDIHTVAFANQFIGVAGSVSGRIIRTSDGGATWSLVNSSGSYDLYGIEFININTGIAVGNNNAIYKTTNSGLSWNSVEGISGDFYGVSFMQGTGYGITVGRSSIIYKTADYSDTWRQISISQTIDLHDVKVLDNGTCFAVGSNFNSSSGNIIKSTDYGETWTTVTHPSTGTLYGIYFQGNDAGWAVGD